MVEPSFWAGKTVLLTGHTGFKGSWLSLWLQDMGANVIGYALAAPTNPSLFEAANVAEGMVSIEADIRDFSALSSVFEQYRPEIVIHMAAQPLVRYSYANPIETYSTNVMGTVHLLEAARQTGSMRAIVNVTSDKCYENREWAWGYRENEPMGGYDPYSNSKGCAELVASAYRSSYFNSHNFAELSSVFEQYQPEIVIHMAAQPLVRYSYANPIETYSTNVMGTVHLLEAARQTGSMRAIVNVTSDKCYENREWAWGYRENEAMGGYDPYSNSKGCAELVASAYRSSYFNSHNFAEHQVALASARAGNVIGGGDWAEDRLIPDIMRAIMQGKPVHIRNPHAIRPWQHVLEPLSGYLLLAQKLYQEGAVFAEGWNFGPNDDDAKPVQWIVERLTEAWGEGASWQLDQGDHPHEAHYLKLDCSKAKSRLDWQPRWNLDVTLGKIVTWHKAYKEKMQMREITLKQIADFQSNKGA
ncbi:MAG: CDP-glucose 4,6-dehydratase [Methylobacter sp.]